MPIDDAFAADLKLTMDNDARVYPKLQALRAHVVKDSCAAGRVRESTMAAAFMPVVRAEARRYTAQFGDRFSAAALREVAREYVREVKGDMNRCLRDARYCGDLDLPEKQILTSGRCKVPPSGQLARGRRRRRR